jgi:hypothetical protein
MMDWTDLHKLSAIYASRPPRLVRYHAFVVMRVTPLPPPAPLVAPDAPTEPVEIRPGVGPVATR